MHTITQQQTDRLRHIAQTWRGSQTDLVWTMCGSEFHVHRVHSRLWQCYQDQRLIGASQNPDGAIGHAMRVYVNQPTKPTMKHQILNYAGDLLGTIDIDEFRAAQIADAKQDAPSEDGVWHFTAGDWLTDEEIESLGTSHEEEVQIIPSAEGGAQ